MTDVAGTTDTETLSDEGSSCTLELAEGRILRITGGLEAFCSTDEGLTWEGGPLQDGDEQISGGRKFSLCRLKSGAVAILYNREERLPGRPLCYPNYFRTSHDEGKPGPRNPDWTLWRESPGPGTTP